MFRYLVRFILKILRYILLCGYSMKSENVEATVPYLSIMLFVTVLWTDHAGFKF